MSTAPRHEPTTRALVLTDACIEQLVRQAGIIGLLPTGKRWFLCAAGVTTEKANTAGRVNASKPALTVAPLP